LKSNVKALSRVISAFLVTMLLAVSVMPALPAIAASKGDVYTVKADYTRLRAKPVSGSAVLTKLRKGVKVAFIKDYGGWWRVELSNGKTGFIYRTNLRPYLNAKVGKVYKSSLKSKLLPVRSAPNSTARVLGKVRNTTRLVLLSKSGGWGLIRVVANGKVGYVDLRYLKAIS